MELRCIRTFSRIAEVGSFTRVASELGYTQSAVTMQVKQLERELGCDLFERVGRNIRLTPEGERLVPVAHTMLQAADEAARIAREPGEVVGSLRIGALDSLLMSVLPGVLSDLSRTYPKVCVSTHQGLLDEEFAMLRRNDIDILLFLDERVNYPEWVKVMEKPGAAGFYAAAGNPMAAEKDVPLERALAAPLYLTERSVAYRKALEQAVCARGLALEPRVECGNTSLLIQLAQSTEGLTFLPAMATSAAVAAGNLAPVDVRLEPVDIWYQMVHHKNKAVTPQMRLFMTLVDAVL
ncbi:MAG: LysR family transcriptional regulator [Coriobacteriia bacterium]|nr:LysR family transcriptional regulator [Coriobacteriia bacterium]